MITLKRGMTGDDVRAWQKELVDVGLLNSVDVIGVFGPRTEKATIQCQLDHGLAPDGIVGPATQAAIGSAPRPAPAPPGIFDPRWRFIQAKGYTPAAGRVVTMIPMHAMQAPERPDTAEAVAAWFGGVRGTAPKASSHVTVDSDSIVQCVLPGDVAWGAQGANNIGYHVEQPGYANWTREQWLAPDSSAMLTLAASHVKLACDHFGLPIAALARDEVAALIRDALIRQHTLPGVLSGHPGGICQHSDITYVWQDFLHYGLPNPRKMPKPFWPDHVDCGAGYPMDELLERARSG